MKEASRRRDEELGRLSVAEPNDRQFGLAAVFLKQQHPLSVRTVKILWITSQAKVLQIKEIKLKNVFHFEEQHNVF